MKLYVSGTSPYSRKVRLVILEKGLVEQVDEQWVNPFESNNELVKINPLGKIPVLILENGETLFDSPVICRYLDSLPSDQPVLIPDDNQWQVLRWQALADGLTDAIYNLVMERRRPDDEQSASWVTRWTKDVENALREIESELDQLGEEITLAHLAVASAIGYLELRTSTLLYDSARPQVAKYPKLHSWYEKFKTRASMLATHPKE